MPALLASESAFGNALRDARKARGLDQAELGQMVDVAQGTVSRWEKGTHLPEPEHMHILHRELGLSWDAYGTEVAKRISRSRCFGHTDPDLGLYVPNMDSRITLAAAA